MTKKTMTEQTPLESLLSHRDSDYFTTRELWETGLIFFVNPRDHLMSVTYEIWPTINFPLPLRKSVVDRAIAELRKLRELPPRWTKLSYEYTK